MEKIERACIKNIENNKLVTRTCKYIFVTFQFVIGSFFSCCQATERNYDAIKGAGIVWRASPVVDIYLPGKNFRCDFSKLHANLKKNTADDRRLLGEQQSSWNVLRPDKGNGNCACACLSIIYADGKQDDQFIVPKISTKTTLPDRFFLNGFTTLKTNSTVNSAGVGITRGAPNALKDVRSLISKKDEQGYLDAELQIVHELYFSSTPQMRTLLEYSIKNHKNIPIVLVVLNIYSELAPCGWCGPMLRAFSERVNKDKKIGKWYDGAHKDLKAKFDQELEKLRNIYKTMEEVLDDDTKEKRLSELTKEVLFPYVTKNKLSQARVDKYLEQKKVVIEAEIKNFVEYINNYARFMVITSSSQSCHRSREIGLDPVFMDAELSKLPMTVNLGNNDFCIKKQATIIPENFVIFTTSYEVYDFPLLRISTTSGFSYQKLITELEKLSDISSPIISEPATPALATTASPSEPLT